MRTITVLESLPFVDNRIFPSGRKVVSTVHRRRKESGRNREKQCLKISSLFPAACSESVLLV
jgi:hypothetical protein